MPAYGWNWQIYDTPENLGKYYRGVSHTYYGAKELDDGPTISSKKQHLHLLRFLSSLIGMITIKGRLPFRISTTTWKDKTPEHYSYPLMGEVYKRRGVISPLTGKHKRQTLAVLLSTRNAQPDSYSGIVLHIRIHGYARR